MAAEYNGEGGFEVADTGLRERLEEDRPLLLDGALGTELERRGVGCALPLWSGHALLHAPELVRAIHSDYLAAGVDVLTANTFRTQERVLARAGLAGRAAALTSLAVSLAREAVASQPERAALVLGSAAPLEDCYQPERVPESGVLAREHGRHAANLRAAGVDGILIETMSTAREAVAAARAAADVGLPFVVSFLCGADGRLASGELLAAGLSAVAALGPAGVAVNCLPPSAVSACLPTLAGQAAPFGVYANLGAPDPGGGARSEALDPSAYAAQARGWTAAGARLIGGCCGTTPAHLRAISAGS